MFFKKRRHKLNYKNLLKKQAAAHRQTKKEDEAQINFCDYFN